MKTVSKAPDVASRASLKDLYYRHSKAQPSQRNESVSSRIGASKTSNFGYDYFGRFRSGMVGNSGIRRKNSEISSSRLQGYQNISSRKNSDTSSNPSSRRKGISSNLKLATGNPYLRKCSHEKGGKSKVQTYLDSEGKSSKMQERLRGFYDRIVNSSQNQTKF